MEEKEKQVEKSNPDCPPCLPCSLLFSINPLPPSHRYDQYESFDSRSSALTSSRDLYRSGGSSYGYGDGRGDNMLLGQRGGSGFGGGIGLGGGGGFDSPSSSYGVAKMRQNIRDSFSSAQGGGSGGGGGGGGWAGAGRRSPRRGGSTGGRGAGGGFGSRRSDPTPLGGGGRGSGSGGQSHRGHSPGGGRGKLPSLLSNRMYPESGGFHQGSIQGPHDFPGRHFGGGPRAGRQRGRKRPLNKVSTSSQIRPPQTLGTRLALSDSLLLCFQPTGKSALSASACYVPFIAVCDKYSPTHHTHILPLLLRPALIWCGQKCHLELPFFYSNGKWQPSLPSSLSLSLFFTCRVVEWFHTVDFILISFSFAPILGSLKMRLTLLMSIRPEKEDNKH